jgi:hypothetical protein
MPIFFSICCVYQILGWIWVSFSGHDPVAINQQLRMVDSGVH